MIDGLKKGKIFLEKIPFLLKFRGHIGLSASRKVHRPKVGKSFRDLISWRHILPQKELFARIYR